MKTTTSNVQPQRWAPATNARVERQQGSERSVHVPLSLLRSERIMTRHVRYPLASTQMCVRYCWPLCGCLQCHLIPDIHTTDGHCNTKTMWESVMKWKHRFHRRAILRQDSQTAQCVDVALVKMILPQATADSTKWTCGSNLNCSVRWIVIAGNRLEATPPSSSMGGNSAKRMNTCGISRCIPNMRFHCTDDKISHSSTIQEWYRPNWKPVHASRSWVSRAPSKVSTPVALAARHVLL